MVVVVQKNTGQSPATEKSYGVEHRGLDRLGGQAPRLIHAREPSAAASRGWELS